MFKKPPEFNDVAGFDPTLLRHAEAKARINWGNQIAQQAKLGLIAPEVAEAASRWLVRQRLERDIATDPVQYRQAKKDGSFDRLRNIAGGYETGRSDDAIAAEQRTAFTRVALNAVSDGVRTGVVSPRAYNEFVEGYVAPNIADRTREKAGLVSQPDSRDQPVDLDNPRRELTEREHDELAARYIYVDKGIPVEDVPAPEKPAEPKLGNYRVNKNAVSDWSAADMERYRHQRFLDGEGEGE